MAYIGMNQRSPYGEYLRTHGNRGFDWRVPVFGLGAPIAASFAPALFSGAGAGAGAASTAAGTAGTAATTAAGVGAGAAGAGGMTIGNLLKMGELGTGLFTNVIGQRQQNRALDRDALMRQNEFAAQMAMLQAQNEQARRQWEADQQQRANEYALALEDRNRRIKLDDEREARRTQYRTTIGDPALLRMRDLLRLGAR